MFIVYLLVCRVVDTKMWKVTPYARGVVGYGFLTSLYRGTWSLGAEYVEVGSVKRRIKQLRNDHALPCKYFTLFEKGGGGFF